MSSHHLDYWLFENQQPSNTTTMYDALPVLTSDKNTSPTPSDLEAPFEYHDSLIDPLSTSSYPPYPTYQESLPYVPYQDSYRFSSNLPPTPAITDIDSEDISPVSSPMIPKAEPTFFSLDSISAASPNETTEAAPGKHTTSARRRAQNRRAQRAFRERKERHAKELEEKLADLTAKYQALEREHEQLERAYTRLSEGKSSKKITVFEGD